MMNKILKEAISIRAFLGAKDYQESRSFYQKFGFAESIIDNKMSFFRVNANLGFYLQDYYVKDWCDNLMVLLEVNDVENFYTELKNMRLEDEYKGVSFTEIKKSIHGREVFLHDPSGILWHFYEFNTPS